MLWRSQSLQNGKREQSFKSQVELKMMVSQWIFLRICQGLTSFLSTESLLEGLKRAQRSRLEDQRGTEINFELPEFLKDKEKYANVGNKLRKTKFDESPSNSISLYNNIDACNNNEPVVKMNTSPPHYAQKPPQPAPRLSLTGKSPTKLSTDISSVQSKISSLENAIMMGTSTTAAKIYNNSRSNTPIDLNLSTQCLPSNTPMKSRSSDSPIYYSPDGSSGIYAGETFDRWSIVSSFWFSIIFIFLRLRHNDGVQPSS